MKQSELQWTTVELACCSEKDKYYVGMYNYVVFVKVMSLLYLNLLNYSVYSVSNVWISWEESGVEKCDLQEQSENIWSVYFGGGKL